MDDVTVSAARICAIGEVIPAEKPWLDPARPGKGRDELFETPLAAYPCQCGACAKTQAERDAIADAIQAKFVDVMSTVVADCPGWDDLRLIDLGGPTAVVEWEDGSKSLYALDTDETAEQVVEHLRRQRGA